MAFAFPWTALVTVLALLVYLWTGLMVGRARTTHKVEAPAMSGPPEFERAMRVQNNTLEQIVLYLPVLWLFAALWGDLWAAIIGVVWPIGRVIYAQGYYQAAEKRHAGFGVTILPTLVLLVGTLVGVFVRGF